MKKINTKIVALAALIDIGGTTVFQVLVNMYNSSNALLMSIGILMSLIAGYFLVSKNQYKVDHNLYALSVTTFTIGLIFLVINNVASVYNISFLLLTPILNFVGGFAAAKYKKVGKA